MKFKNLILLSTTALLSVAILPAATAQDGEHQFNRGAAGAKGHHQRGPSFGPARHRPGRPGDNPKRLIGHLDTDGDGYVDEDEFIDSRLASVDEQFDRRDMDGDGLLNEDEASRPRHRDGNPTVREEVIACVRETIADWEGPHEVEDHFDTVDTDGDGYISLVELSTALQERAYVLFDRIDSNGDGLISLEEVEAHQDEQIKLRRTIHACIDKVTDPFEATL
jgi:Ca2+-binding EF-hand superfamily protein